MAENKKEIELVKKLKDSFPDMLDFNNNLKELKEFWFQSKEKDVLKILTDFYNEFILNRNCEKDSKLFIELFKKYFQGNKLVLTNMNSGANCSSDKEKEMLDDEIKFLEIVLNCEVSVGLKNLILIRILNLKERRNKL